MSLARQLRLTGQQELALRRPYTDADIKRQEKEGPNTEHMSTRWLTTDLQVLTLFTVAAAGPQPFWHVSLSVHVRDAGTIFVRSMDIKLRRRLRDIAQDLVKGVGHPADGDRWDIEDKSLHLRRDLTSVELDAMGKV